MNLGAKHAALGAGAGELVGGIDRAEEALLELQRNVARLRDQAADLSHAGLVGLDLERALVAIADLERALVAIATVSRALQRAYRGAEELRA